MKKLTALLLCFLILCTCSVSVLAAEPEAVTTTVISLTVPDSHKITVTADHAKVFYGGVSGEEFSVERLGEPRILICAESGKIIKTVTVNGEDVTDELHGGYLELPPVYEDKVISVTTEDEPAAPKENDTGKGEAEPDGKPLTDVATTEEAEAGAPPTGDHSTIHLWWLLLIISSVCVVMLGIASKKKKAFIF